MKKKARITGVLSVVLTVCCCVGIGLSILMKPTLAEPQAAATVRGAIDENSLKDAISKSVAGDIVEIRGDITLAANTTLAIGKEIIIQSGGGSHTIFQKGAKVRHFRISTGGRLTLQDITLSGEDVSGGVQIAGGGEMVMKSGAVIRNCLAASYGGGVDMASTSKLTICDGAVIRDCDTVSTYGGGGLYAGGTVLMEGGEITQNSSAYGGGVYVSKDTVMTMLGGDIADNTSDYYGGGVYMSNFATLDMYGGSIRNNTSVLMGGGVLFSNDKSLFTMYGGEISGNRSAQGGGIGLYNAGALFTMKGGTISGNVATGVSREGYGGGLYLNGGAEAVIYAGTFSGNSTTDAAGGHGGAIYTSSSTSLTVYNAIVTDNSAVFEGGGIWVCNTGNAYTNEFRGMIAYNNRVDREKNGRDIHLNHANTVATLSNVALGNGVIKWRNEADNAELTQLAGLKGKLSLTAEISQDDIELAEQYATVLITGNTSQYRGGGIAINGKITFGSIVPGTINLRVNKVWQGAPPTGHPGSVTVFLVKDGEKQTDRVVTLSSDNDWTASFTDLLYKDAGGRVILYAVEEEVPPSYTATYSKLKVGDDGHYKICVTNTWVPEQTERSVRKIWRDDDDAQRKRPDSVTVQLYADGQAHGGGVVLTASGGWRHTWSGLPRYDGDAEIAYTVAETKVGGEAVAGGMAAGYAVSYGADGETGGITVTNTLVSAELTLRKVDATHTDEGLPGAVFTLYACGGGDGHTHSVYVSEDADCCWAAIDTQTSGGDGLVRFQALGSGDYMLVETQAPPGYQRPAGQWQIRIDAAQGIKTVTAVGRSLAVLAKKDGQGTVTEYLLLNEKQYELPQTGGIGQLTLPLTGAALIGGGLLTGLRAARKKRRNRHGSLC